LSNFLVQFSRSFSAKLGPNIRNPQYTNRNIRKNYSNPRNPHPLWDHTLRSPTRIECKHFVHKIQYHETLDNRIHCVKEGRHEIVQFRGKYDIILLSIREHPSVLARASDLGMDEEYKYGVGAMRDQVPTCEEDEERCQVVGYEEEVFGVEDNEMEKVH
ncbi:hypothetical protein F2P56_023943, partial [Juglans regia]